MSWNNNKYDVRNTGDLRKLSKEQKDLLQLQAVRFVDKLVDQHRGRERFLAVIATVLLDRVHKLASLDPDQENDSDVD
jgi:hypothetical protein